MAVYCKQWRQAAQTPKSQVLLNMSMYKRRWQGVGWANCTASGKELLGRCGRQWVPC